MGRISIIEKDYTTPNVESINNEVVFVPGFAVQGSVDKPVLCSSPAAFKREFGDTAARFLSPQLYPVDGTVPVPSATAETTISDGSVSVVAATIYAVVGEAGTYVFTYTSENTWILNSGEINLSEYGITIVAGTPAEDDTITVVVTTSVPGGAGFALSAVPDPVGRAWFESNMEDPSYTYALNLLNMGLRVIYCRMNSSESEVTVENAYLKLAQYFDTSWDLTDKSEYDFKYLTSGGYPVFEYSTGIASKMATLAATRGDCIALIDHTDNPYRPLIGPTSVLEQIRSNSSFGNEYSAMFTPWATFEGISSSMNLPGSYGYLITLGNMIQTTDPWMSVAGVTRGGLYGLSGSDPISSTHVLTNTIAEEMAYQSSFRCINPFTKVNGAQTIWGNRTLFNNTNGTTAKSFLNIRNLICDVKKQVYIAARSVIFDPNDDVLWANFKSLVTPLLDKMKTGRGLSNYKILKGENSTDRTKLVVVIKLYPVYSVESVDITIELLDDDTVNTAEE